MYLCGVLRISTHIEQLLWINDCVIIPDFGGFVLQNQRAVYAEWAHTFYPPHKEIVFNPALRHDDGLLSESYMQMYGMTFGKARLALKKEVEELKSALEEQGQVSLAKTGSFRKGEEGGYLFEPDTDTPLFNVDSYGLAKVYLSPVPVPVPTATEQTQQMPPERKTGRVIYLPIHRMVFRAAGIMAASVALFLLLSPPVKEIAPSSYTAGILFSETLSQQSAVVAQPLPDTPVAEQQTATPATALIDTVAQPLVTASPQPSPATPDPSKSYYVIIGSFLTDEQAGKFLAAADSVACVETGIVKQDKNIRVYAARYTNRKEAETYMYQLRTNEKYKDAWLYVHRETN
jgi:hypothetical protein